MYQGPYISLPTRVKMSMHLRAIMDAQPRGPETSFCPHSVHNATSQRQSDLDPLILQVTGLVTLCCQTETPVHSQ